MDIIRFAMQMELDGQAFYEKGAAATDNPQLKEVLLTLAEEEQKHYRVFKSMSDGDLAAAESSLGKKSGTPALTKSVFQQMAEGNVETLAVKMCVSYGRRRSKSKRSPRKCIVTPLMKKMMKPVGTCYGG